MLTDRQNAFLERIQILSVPGAPGNRQEQGCMNETKGKIQDGWDFKWSINSMNLFLQKLQEQGQISLEAKKLYDDLVAIYGEPDEKMEETIPREHPKDWDNADPDLVYTGTGGVSGWGRRYSGDSEEHFWRYFVFSLFSQIIFWGMPILMLLLYFGSIFSGLRKGLGVIGFRVFIVVLLLVYFAWLIISGSLKSKKKTGDETIN